MFFEPRDYLRHILVEVDYLIDQQAGLSYERFSMDETLQRAFVRSLTIIGEAAKKVPRPFRAQHPEVEWRAMSGMRDRLIHNYFGVDYELIWDVIKNRIPELRRQVASILEAWKWLAGVGSGQSRPRQWNADCKVGACARRGRTRPARC